MTFTFGFLCGFFAFLVFFVIRFLRAEPNDSSNIFNPLRVLAYVAIHPERLHALIDPDQPIEDHAYRPFWYVKLDEFKGVVETKGKNDD